MRPQKAFVLIKTDPGREREVADKLNKLPEVKEVHIITGEWDILAVVETERELVLPTDKRCSSWSWTRSPPCPTSRTPTR